MRHDFNPGLPYNELPPLPPAGDIVSPYILRKTITASRALSELKGAVRSLPNPTLFVDTINLQEAQASSEIENVITSQDELYTAASMEQRINDPATKEVIHYKEALWHGVGSLKSRPILTTNLFIEIVRIIKENDAGVRKLPGTQLKKPVSGEVIYTPPVGEDRIRNLLQNLEEYIHSDDGVDPLIKMAVMHYQFEAIHPFYDGNGRAGRIVLILFLIHQGLLDLPCIFLSRYIMEHKSQYYEGLRGVTERSDWETWLLYMLDMIESSASRALTRIEKIDRAMKEMSADLQQQLPKIYSKELLEVLFRLPYSKRQFLHNAGLGTLKTVGRYLVALENAGFLSSKQVGKEKLYLNRRLMAALS